MNHQFGSQEIEGCKFWRLFFGQMAVPALFLSTWVCTNEANSDLHNNGCQVTTYLMGILRDMYMPGVSDEGARDGSCYEVRLNGSPWSHNSSYNLGWTER